MDIFNVKLHDKRLDEDFLTQLKSVRSLGEFLLNIDTEKYQVFDIQFTSYEFKDNKELLNKTDGLETGKV